MRKRSSGTPTESRPNPSGGVSNARPQPATKGFGATMPAGRSTVSWKCRASGSGPTCAATPTIAIAGAASGGAGRAGFVAVTGVRFAPGDLAISAFSLARMRLVGGAGTESAVDAGGRAAIRTELLPP